MRKLRWGILGTGRIAHSFAEDLRFVANGEVAAVASRHAHSAATFARFHGIARTHAGYDALITDPEIDAIYIATPHVQHADQAAAALRAGKAVLCEKPLVLDPAECERLLGVARETGGYLMEGMWTWFLPAIRQAQAWVAAGRIGRIRHIQADFGYPQLPYSATRREYDASLGGGCLPELGIYPIAFAWLFQRADPLQMQVLAHHAPNGVEDDVTMQWRYADSVATLGCSFRCKLRNWAYVIGDEGYIAIPDFWRASEALHYRLDECVEHFRDGRTTLGFNYEAAAFGEDVLAGQRQPAVVTHVDSLQFQQHLAQVRQAMAAR